MSGNAQSLTWKESPAGELQGNQGGELDKQAIQSQLERVTSSPEFDTSQRSLDFLRFIVTKSLEGRGQEISQHSIAGSVFGRGDNFDPTVDPIVRMQAGRVRRSLEHYYLTDGINDPILIGLPKGTYVPRFANRENRQAGRQAAPRLIDFHVNPWPTLLIKPLHNLTNRDDIEFVALGMTSDLAAELSRDKAIHVFLSPGRDSGSKQSQQARFVLSGNISLREDALKINFHLMDGDTGRQTWAQTAICPQGPNQGCELEKLVQKTAAVIAEEHGILSTHLAEETRNSPSATGTAYEAILRHHHFEVTHDPEDFLKAMSSLRQAVESNPDCALCWSYLARLGGIHWSLGIPGESIPIEESILAARRGTEIAPMDVRCRILLAYVLLVADDTGQARAEAEMALQLTGPSLFWLDSIGYLLTLTCDWERGPELIRKALQVNPYPRRACYSALWLDAFHRGDAEEALDFSSQYAPETFFWSPLMMAVSLVMNNRAEEAHTHIQSLLQIKPDFLEHAHWLITRYVKSESLVQRIKEALRQAGMKGLE